MMGGSIADCLKRNGYFVSAIDNNQDTIDYALANNIIDEGSLNTEIIKDADIIILCLYPNTIVDWVKENQKHFKEHALLTDITGVKSEIVPTLINILRSDMEFIAAHPMAGKEVSGVKYADEKIFKNANFIVTPTSENTENAISTIKQLASILGFKNISELTLYEHDQMIAYLSQLTHVIAVVLMNMKDNKHLVEYTGDSFRDLTRIAKINEELWSELFFMNKQALLTEIEHFELELKHFKNVLDDGDTDRLKRLLTKAKERRLYFDERK